MQNYKRYFVGIIAFFCSLVIGWLSLFHPNWLLLYTLFSFIFGYLLIWICLTPAGSVTFGRKDEGLSLLGWFAKLLLGQGVLVVFTLASYIAFFSHGPSFAVGEVTFAFANAVVKDYSRWMWGIFPWGFYGFWGMILGYIVYLKKGKPFLYQLARGFLTKRFEPMPKAYIEGTVNGATMIALSLVACAITLLFSYGIENLYKVQHFEVPAMTYMVLSFFMLFLTIKPGRRFLARLTVKSQSYILFFSFMVIALVCLFILSGFINAWFAKAHPALAKLPCVACRNYFQKIPEEVRFAAIYWGWFVIWTPLAGSYLAKISKGRSLREFVLGLFFLPALLFIVNFYWGTAPYEKCWLAIKAAYTIPFSNPALQQSMMLLSFALLTLALFTLLIKQFNNSTIFSSGYMPVTADAKENRLWLADASKSKGISKVVQKIAMVMMGTLFVHTISGWYGVQVEVLAMAILVLNALYMAFHLIIIRFLKDRLWIGNQNSAPF